MDEREKTKYYAELTAAALERTIKRLWILLVLLAVLLFASNGLWLWYISQYEFESYAETYMQDGDGLNIIGDRNGVIFDGTDAAQDGTPPADMMAIYEYLHKRQIEKAGTVKGYQAMFTE